MATHFDIDGYLAARSQDLTRQKLDSLVNASREKVAELEVYRVGIDKRIADRQIELADSPWARGMEYVGSSLTMFDALIRQNAEAATKETQRIANYRRLNPSSRAAQNLSAAWEPGDISAGFIGVKDQFKKDIQDATSSWEAIKATGRNVEALGAGLVTQLPNMLLPMVGMGVGALAGSVLGPAGTVAGGLAGRAAVVGGMALGAGVGTTAVVAGEMAAGELERSKVDQRDPVAVQAFFESNSGRVLAQSAVKGFIIGAVDAATMLLSVGILRGPGRAAADRAMTALGVDMANPIAIAIARKNLTTEIATKIAADPLYIASISGARSVGRSTAAFALEPAGEFTGELLGEGIATGEFKPKDAVLEAMSSLGQSAITFAGQKVYQAATSPIRAAAEKKEALAIEEATTQQTAIDTGNVEGRPTIAAIAALAGNSQKPETDAVGRQRNLDKATSIMDGLEEQRDKLAAIVMTDADRKAEIAKLETSMADPKKAANKALYAQLIKAEQALVDTPYTAAQKETATKELDKLNKDFATAETHMVGLASLVKGKQDVNALIAAVSFSIRAPTETDTKEDKESLAADVARSATAAVTLRNLAMASPEDITPAQATQIAKNENGALTEPVVAYWRAFSESRIAHNKAQTKDGVSNEILIGSDKNVGIAQYRERIGKAIRIGNEIQADRQMDLLSKFEQDHRGKAEASAKALTGV